MKTRPFVSIIIPTLHREKALCDTLMYLFDQDYPKYEIIVVDQSVRHREETLKFLNDHKTKIKYFQISKKGTTIAKNYGLKCAKGEIILFVDDDIKPAQNLISEHVVNYENQNIGGVSGRIEVQDNSMIKDEEGKVGFVTKDGRFIDNYSSKTSCEVMTVHGCNASFRKDFLDKVHGFDENFTGFDIREDSDISFRIRRLGYKLVFDPHAEVLHLKASGGSRDKDRITWYEDFFRNEMLFFMKHLPHRYLVLRILNKIRPILSCMFYYGKGNPRAIIAPWRGFINGYKLYKKEIKDRSEWL